MKKVKKQLLKLIIVILLMFAIMPVEKVYAENKEYDINKLEVNVNIDKDGNAIITENWYLDFTSGNFTRFQKDIYNPGTNLEHVDIDKNSIKVFINDTKCEITNNTKDRKEFTYYLSTDDDITNLQWYYPTNKEQVKYTVTYKLNDAIVETDNNVAIFCYRYVGVDFDKTIEEINVLITAPDESPISINYSNKEYTEAGTNPKKITVEESNNLVKINIAMDANIFNDLRFCDLETLNKENEEKKDLPIAGILFIVFFVISFIFGILSNNSNKSSNTYGISNNNYNKQDNSKASIREEKLKNQKIKYTLKLEENKWYFNDLIDKCENSEIDPIHYILSDYDASSMRILKSSILNLIRKKLIKNDLEEN